MSMKLPGMASKNAEAPVRAQVDMWWQEVFQVLSGIGDSSFVSVTAQ